MRVMLNIIWLVLCGFWMFLAYILTGIIACILIITIPFGIASFRIAGFALWPFGRTMVNKPDAGCAVVHRQRHLVHRSPGCGWPSATWSPGIALCITIIGIPLAMANFKLIPVSLAPLGKQIVKLNDPPRCRPSAERRPT